MKFPLASPYLFIFFLLVFPAPLFAQQVNLLVSGTQFTAPANVHLNAEPEGVTYPEPAHMLVENSMSGFRKLKFGYSPVSLYNPVNNVVNGGNDHLEITMRVVSGNIDWNKIMVKPMGLGNLSLQPYVQVGGEITDEYFTISIPLSDFSSSVNFTQVSNIEFPYSAGASPFVIAVAKMKFTGGTTPFLWFGDNKTDNMQNGNGGPGELIAHLVPANYPAVYPEKVVFKYDENILGEDAYSPYEYEWTTPDPGSYAVKANLVMSDGQVIESEPVQIDVLSPPPPPATITLSRAPAGDSLQAPANMELTATIDGMTPPPPDYILVTNTFTGYRKLKFGYSPTSLYNPAQNVVAGGNTNLEIVLRDVTGGADWSKIQIRPGGAGTLALSSYVSAAGGVGSEWATLNIPLSDFSSSVNFAAVANLEFPYSANAANFQLAIKSIRFTGGTTPFVWFGFGKNDNKHNGNGGAGELFANIFLGMLTGDHIEKVEFYNSATKIGEDFIEPYQLDLTGLNPGIYHFTAKMTSYQGVTVTSSVNNLVVYEIPPVPSTMSVSIKTPETETNYLSPLNLPVQCSATGEVLPGPDYMQVVNTLTGYIKLRFGYSHTSLTLPKQNVISGGNDTLEIVMKNLGGTVDWSKIRLRPEGIGSLNLGPYVPPVTGIGSDWTKIKIPLSAFDTTIHFNAIGFLDFPYSAGANSFRIAIQSIRFSGGSTPFNWFGNGKTDNANDGDGGFAHMTATLVSPNALAVNVSRMFLYDNGILINQDSVAPWNPVLANPAPGNHALFVKMLDTKGAVCFSDTVVIHVLTSVPADDFLLTVNLDMAPATYTFEKARLRYNKDFAYTFSLDDGLVDAYTCAFKLLGGGYSPATQQTYPGLFYTDGCGNNLPFKGTLMWYSVSSSFNDIHVSTPSYVSWLQLNEMLAQGWGIANHSYSHATDPLTTNFPYQITANDSAVFTRTGVHLTQFAAPGGSNSVGYYPLAWEKGIKCAYSRTTTFGNPFGAQVDNNLNYNQFTIYRDYKCDDTHNLLNIMNGINSCATLSQNGKHYWYIDFTHHVSPNQVSGSLLFNLFKYYQEQIAGLYGQAGSDRIWAASGTEVFEYLKLRDSSKVTCSWWGNQLKIMIDRSNLPANLLRYAMSFNISADANILSVTSNVPSVALTFRGNTPAKLINAEWHEAPNAPLNPSSGMNIIKDAFQSEEDLTVHQVEGGKTLLIHNTGKLSGYGQVYIFDKLGNEVFTAHVTIDPQLVFRKIDLPELPGGVYLVRFISEKGEVITGKYVQPQ